MEKKRILMISPGPVFKIRTDKLKGLSANFVGDVITSSPIKEIINTNEVYGFNYNCTFYNVRFPLISNLLFFFFAVRFCVKRRLSGTKHDLVVTYDPLKTGLIGLVCAWILNTRFAPEVNGVYTSPAEYIDDAKSFSTRIKRIMYPIIEGFILKRSDGIKVQYPNQLAPFKRLIKTEIVRCFHNYVDIDKFLEGVEIEEKKEILFVGFPFYRKGVDILISAFKLISSDYPEWKLKILGWYPNPTTLNKAIDGHPQIIYQPPVHPDEMPLHICSCAIFVMPSRSEAKARTLIESMAAGKARIGSNIDGTPTIIADGIDGLLFESENIFDLAEKMRLLIDSPDLRMRLGQVGRIRAQQEFNKDKYYTDLTNFYFEVINKNIYYHRTSAIIFR